MLERLQKIISRAGIASRRHAEELIRSGQVRVNGVTVTELGAKADPEHDRVEAAGKVARISAQRAYILLHKPPNVVATLADPEGRPTVRNFLVGVSERVFPVGRLDYAASGLVFLTDDGDLAARMLKAAPALPQTYWVKVRGRVSEEQLRILARALRGKIHPLRATHAAGKNPANPWYEAELAGASRDLLRRNLFAIGHAAEKLKRIQLASLELGPVEEGHYRRLEPSEVAKLVRAVDRALTQERPAAALVPLPARPRKWSPKWPAKRPGSQPSKQAHGQPQRHGQAQGSADGQLHARPGNLTGGGPPGRPDARPGARPEKRPGGQTIGRPNARPDGRPGGRSGRIPDGRSGGRPDRRPDQRPDRRPDTRHDRGPRGRSTGRPPARPGAPTKPHSTRGPSSQRPHDRKQDQNRPPAGKPPRKPSWKPGGRPGGSPTGKPSGKPPWKRAGKHGGKPPWTRKFDRK